MQDKDDTTPGTSSPEQQQNCVCSADLLSAHGPSFERLSAGRVTVLFVSLLTALAVNFAPATNLRLNLSASMPRGIYVLTTAPLQRGAIVAFCVNREAASLALARHYLGPGTCPDGREPLVKNAVGVAADVVVTSRESVEVNGVALAASHTLERDSRGRSIAHYPFGQHVMGPYELWVFSSAPRSWDSRYFGPVHVDQVVGIVKPVFTVG
jgi:conjugative transfer signal peptidase TraF